jgi:hypothetical protein
MLGELLDPLSCSEVHFDPKTVASPQNGDADGHKT